MDKSEMFWCLFGDSFQPSYPLFYWSFKNTTTCSLPLDSDISSSASLDWSSCCDRLTSSEIDPKFIDSVMATVFWNNQTNYLLILVC